MEQIINLVFLGVIVILIIGILTQSRLTNLEKKLEKQSKLSIENNKILEKLSQDTIWLIKDLEGEILELQNIIKNNKKGD